MQGKVEICGICTSRLPVLGAQETTDLLRRCQQGDQEARQRLIDILCDLPTARMVISHDWDFLSRVCGEYWTIREGRLLSCAPDVRHSHEHVHPLGGEPHWHLPITD